MAKAKNRGNRNNRKPKQDAKTARISAYQRDKQTAKPTRKADRR